MNRRLHRELLPDETVRWQSPALRSVGRATVSGVLAVTAQRILFLPNGFNLGHRSPLSAPLAEVRSVEVVGRTFEAFTGGVRRRIAVGLDGRDELFVVKDVEAAKRALDQLIFDRE